MKTQRRMTPGAAYSAAHANVAKHRGKASEYRCVTCQQQADDWALVADPIADLEPGSDGEGTAMWWSPLVEDYEPKCKACHRREDARRYREREREEDGICRDPETTGAEGWEW